MKCICVQYLSELYVVDLPDGRRKRYQLFTNLQTGELCALGKIYINRKYDSMRFWNPIMVDKEMPKDQFIIEDIADQNKKIIYVHSFGKLMSWDFNDEIHPSVEREFKYENPELFV